jgi:RNA polymerase sigma-70 factor, ECF subfamily
VKNGARLAIPPATSRCGVGLSQAVTIDNVDSVSSSETAGREAALAEVLRQGRAAWPGIEVGDEQFAAFLARHLPELSAEALERVRARELYLVCAYGLGLRPAHDALETEYMPRVARALRRLGTQPALIADLSQELRGRLIEMADPSAARRGYSGLGDLGKWLALCAVREARRRGQRGRREQPLADAALEVLPAAGADPELEALVEHYKEPFQAAFRAALAALTSRERNLLRYQFLRGVGIDAIARLYDVHRATAARWVLRAQARLGDETRAQVLALIGADTGSVSRIAVLLRSRLSLSLAALLPVAEEPEPPEPDATT